jgi:hypothetical protein
MFTKLTVLIYVILYFDFGFFVTLIWYIELWMKGVELTRHTNDFNKRDYNILYILFSSGEAHIWVYCVFYDEFKFQLSA